MSPTTLAGVVVALDEPRELARTLESLRTAVDEIAVLDPGAIEGVEAVVGDARVVSRPWEGARAAREWLAEAVRADWILMLEPGETLDPAMIPAMRQTLPNAPDAGFWLTLRTVARDGTAQDGRAQRLFPRKRFAGFGLAPWGDPVALPAGYGTAMTPWPILRSAPPSSRPKTAGQVLRYELALRQLLCQDPADREAATRLARLLEARGDHEEASRLWGGRVAPAPGGWLARAQAADRPMTYLQLGSDVLGFGYVGHAGRIAGKGLALAPTHPTLLLLRASCHWREGDKVSAEAVARLSLAACESYAGELPVEREAVTRQAASLVQMCEGGS